MSGLCQYKNMLGIPGEGIHSYRFLNLAIADVVMTILGGVLLAWGMRWNAFITVGSIFLLGIVLHRLFCVRTTIDKLLFPSA
jgi:hypothetical protein